MTKEEIKKKTDELFKHFVAATSEEERLALKQQIFELNIKLAWEFSLRMRSRHILFSEEDVFQNACMKLYYLIDKFDPSQGNAFSTFALAVMKNDFYLNKIQADRCDAQCHRLRKLIDESDCENVEKLQEQLKAYSRFLDTHIASINEPFYNTHDDDAINLVDAIADKNANVMETAEVQEDNDVILSLFGPEDETLSDREKYAIYQYFYKEKNYAEIGRELGVSRQYVEQIIKRAYRKMRPVLAKHFFVDEQQPELPQDDPEENGK